MEPKIKRFKLSEIRPAKYNPRIISDEALLGLTESMKRFGCVEPVVINVKGGKNTIIGGHQRHKVLKKLYGDKYECLCVAVSLNTAEEKLLNLTLNNPKAQGEFIEKLAEYIDSIKKEIGDDKVLLDLQIQKLRDELPEPEEKIGKILDDDIPKPPKTAVTRTGDIWLLGEHRLMCGDSTNEKNVAKLMSGKKAALFATDPPYCVDYTNIKRPNKNGKDWSGTYHEVDVKNVKEFIRQFYTAGLKWTEDNAALYLWHASKHKGKIDDVCEKMGILIHQQIIWVKPCIVMTYTIYPFRHEPCLLMWKKGNMPQWKKNNAINNQIGTVWPVGYVKLGDPMTPEYYTDVWELDWDGKKRPVGFDHPTSKPVEIFAIPMRVHTKPGDICYEPFCGSGSQIIAAEKLGRKCYAIELEPVFCDVAVKRWEEWTGVKAKKYRN